MKIKNVYASKDNIKKVKRTHSMEEDIYLQVRYLISA